MWLDRFSNHPTPGTSPPPSRSSFQAQRRPSHQVLGVPPRPGFSPRSSSLSVAKLNASTTSLNSPRLLPNGSGLRQEIAPPPDLSDPLAVLEEIVGKTLDEGREFNGHGADAGALGKPEEPVEDVDFGGKGLQDFLDEEDEVADDQFSSAISIEECEYVCSSQGTKDPRLTRRR